MATGDLTRNAASAQTRHTGAPATGATCAHPGERSTHCVIQGSHWGELVQGPVFHRGRLITCLITLPRSDRFTIAHFVPKAGRLIEVDPGFARKAQQAARWVLDEAGYSELGGRLSLASNITPGSGSGSSTADIVAAIRVTASAIGFRLSDMAVQQATWEIERASDPLALCRRRSVVVYGSRTGEVIKILPAALPEMLCLGFNADPKRTILTESLIGREGYTEAETDAYAAILGRAEAGIMQRRLDLLAGAATASARLNQIRVPLPDFEGLVRIAREEGALGLAASHSGTVAAALFHPDANQIARRLETLSERLASRGCTDLGVFHTPAD